MALSDSIKSVGNKLIGGIKPMNIIEFAENPQGLNMTLYPMQKLILKMFYRIPLSDDINENKITIRDMFNEKIIKELSEADCLEYLYQKRYCNVNYHDLYVDEIPLNSIQFYIGRRGSKTKMTTIICAFSLYDLLFYDNPHKLFHNKPVTDEISITLVSNSLKGSDRQYRELTGAIKASKFFAPYIVGGGAEGYWLKTRAFMELEDKGLTENKGNIRISSSAANYSVRGDANMIGVLDEYAHYLDSENNDVKENPLDVAMWDALAPSTYEFTTVDGKQYGKMFILSSPNGKKGEAYRRYEDSFKNKSSLMLNMPSFYVNWLLSPVELKNYYNNRVSSYEQEILGMFNAKVSKWIDNPDLIMAASNKNSHNQIGENVNMAYTHYLGIDFGFENDATAIAVCHVEPRIPSNYEPLKEEYRKLLAESGDIYVVDYIGFYQATQESPLDLENLVSIIAKIVRTYGIRKGAYDQWYKVAVEKEMKKYGLHNTIECINANLVNNNAMATIYKRLVREGRLIVPNDADTIPEYSRDWSMSYLDEVFNLVEYKKTGGNIKVENPSGHDDRYKAVEKAIYLAYTKAAPAVDSVNNYSGFASTIRTKTGGAVPNNRGFAYRNNINHRDLRKQVL